MNPRGTRGHSRTSMPKDAIMSRTPQRSESEQERGPTTGTGTTAARAVVRWHGPRAVGVVMVRVAGRILGRRGFSEAALLTHWPAIVGSEVAAICLPARLTFSRGAEKGGTLSLRVAGGGFAIELQHRTVSLIRRINTYFGYVMVEQIRITQGLLPQRPRFMPSSKSIVLPPDEEAILAAELIAVRDDALREAMVCLGRTILRRA